MFRWTIICPLHEASQLLLQIEQLLCPFAGGIPLPSPSLRLGACPPSELLLPGVASLLSSPVIYTRVLSRRLACIVLEGRIHA